MTNKAASKPGTEITEDAQTESQPLAVQSRDLTVAEVLEKREKVQALLAGAMKKGVHYWHIPGKEKEKPQLLKPGCELLSFMFKLAPKIDKELVEDLSGGHKTFETIVGFYHRETNQFWGHGVGICTTMEPNYRYIKKMESTGQKVPPNFWAVKNGSGGWDAANKLIPKGTEVAKVDGHGWCIAKATKIENPDIAGCYNTCKKMSVIRAHRAGITFATASSDLFSQDMERKGVEEDAAKADTPENKKVAEKKVIEVEAKVVTEETVDPRVAALMVKTHKDLPESAKALFKSHRTNVQFAVSTWNELAGMEKYVHKNPNGKERTYEINGKLAVVEAALPDFIEHKLAAKEKK